MVFDGGRAMFWTAIHDSKTDDVIRARGPTCRRGAATCCLVREFASQRAARGLASGIVMANSTAVPWSEVSLALIAPRSPADGRWQAADDGRKNRKWRTHEATRQHRSGGARLRPALARLFSALWPVVMSRPPGQHADLMVRFSTICLATGMQTATASLPCWSRSGQERVLNQARLVKGSLSPDSDWTAGVSAGRERTHSGSCRGRCVPANAICSVRIQIQSTAPGTLPGGP